MIVAVTGATGFIGRPLLERLLTRGCRVRALARRPEALEARPGLDIVPGDILDDGALRRLITGADRVVHLAGLVSTHDPAMFERVNAEGSRRVAAAIETAGSKPTVIAVSSLAAREPALSPYASSKSAGEQAFDGLEPGRTIIVRPPAVYGPGDRGTLPIFQQLVQGWLAAPWGDRRFSMIYVDDLVALLDTLLDTASGTASRPPDGVIEPDDGAPEAYRWHDIARIAGDGLGRHVQLVRLPRLVFDVIAGVAEGIGRWQRKPPLVDRGKVAELFHPDWRCDRLTMDGVRWQAATDFATGFAKTVAWYRSAGWITARSSR